MEERPDLSTIWDRAEVYSLAIPAFFFCLGLVFTTTYFAVDEATQSTLSWMRPPDMATFTTLLTTFAATGLLLLLGMYPIGLLAWYGGVSVAITRKISHVIFISLLPLTVIFLNEQGEGLARDMFLAMVWQSLSSTLLLAIMFSKASRKYLPVLRVAFAGIERSEDRPHALTWFSLQMVGQTMVQIPMIQWMQSNDKGLLIWIPFLSVGLGDGLAEPIGRIWGCAPCTNPNPDPNPNPNPNPNPDQEAQVQGPRPVFEQAVHALIRRVSGRLLLDGGGRGHRHPGDDVPPGGRLLPDHPACEYNHGGDLTTHV